MTKYYGRAWVRDGAVFGVHTNSHPIVGEVFDGWADTILDFEVAGEYEGSDQLVPLLSYGPTGLVCAGRTIEVIAARPGPARDVEAELLEMRGRMTMTFAQLLIGLVTEQWITQAESTAWLTGTPPAAVTTLIGQLPAEQQFPALARAVRPSSVLRLDPLVMAMGQAEGKTPEELDEFFQIYSNV